ncbi:MAG: patatin-like phospholipase family protein [Acidimicrobiales bacterium]
MSTPGDPAATAGTPSVPATGTGDGTPRDPAATAGTPSDGTPSDGTPSATATGNGTGSSWWDRVARRRHRPEQAGPPLTAFVLAGGGSRGAVQVGMLAELVDRGIRADRVYGVSVGAVNAAAYAGDPTPSGMAHLQHVWAGLSGDKIFPRARGYGPWTFFQQRPAVHANTGLRDLLEEGLRFERLEDAAIPLEVVATSLHDGLERWLTEGPAIEAVLASAAIPAMFPPVRIGDELLIDGGVVDNVPISRAIDAGATRVYVLLCGPLHYRPRPARRPVEAVLTGFFVAVHARFARELALVPPAVEVTVFSGGGDPAADYRDFSATSELIAAGRAEVAAVLGAGVGAAAHDGDPPLEARRSQPAGGMTST